MVKLTVYCTNRTALKDFLGLLKELVENPDWREDYGYSYEGLKDLKYSLSNSLGEESIDEDVDIEIVVTDVYTSSVLQKSSSIHTDRYWWYESDSTRKVYKYGLEHIYESVLKEITGGTYV